MQQRQARRLADGGGGGAVRGLHFIGWGQILKVRRAAWQFIAYPVDDPQDCTTKERSPDDAAPSWSPDGKKILFHSNRDEDREEVYVMRADGSNIVRMTEGAEPTEAQ